MSHRTARLFVFVSLLVAVTQISSAASLPPSWASSDIGAVGATGTATGTESLLTLSGAGADVWGTADALRFAYLRMIGDGSVVARVASVDALNAWTKAGVMLRESLAANSRHAFMLVSPGKGLAFQRRVATAGDSTNTPGGSGTAPGWVRLTRTGNTFSAYRSADGVTWTLVGTDTIAMDAAIYAGVAVSSHVSGVLATAAFTSVQVTPAWRTADVGAVGAAGSAALNGGTIRVAGAGADVWGVSDAFRYAYVPMTGDGSIVTQVATVEPVNAWTKAGVMMRESLAANARHAFMFVTPGKGLAFQRRSTTGGDSTHTTGGSGMAPAWVKLTREGSVFSAFRSSDGSNWSLVGTDTIAMGSTIYVGVAVSSHVAGTLATANFTASVLSPLTLTVSDPVGLPPVVTDTMRLLHWNTHHGGVGTDGVYDPTRLAGWIAQMSPDIASLNEVDSQSQVDAIVSALKAKTGVAWYISYSGLGNLVISRLAPTATSRCVYPDGVRYSAHLAAVVNGRPINVWSIHTTVDSADSRLAEVKGLQTCSLSWPQARILAGDYNMQEGSTEYVQAVIGHTDAWLAAKALGTAVNYSGNCDGCTRSSRIDYVFTSTGATFLTLKSARIVDTRNANGDMPSDHKPLVIEYDVK